MEPEALIMELAAQQGGAATRSQLLAAGITDRQMRHRVTAGKWKRIGAGGYQIIHMTDPDDMVRAAVAILPEAVASHSSATRLLGLKPVAGSGPCVTVHSQTTHQFPGVQVVRCHDLKADHVTIADGVRVTTSARTIVDLSARITEGQLLSLAEDAIAAKKTTVAQIASVHESVARRGKPGVVAMRRVLQRMNAPAVTLSVMEAKGLRLLKQADIEGFKIEYPIPWSNLHRFDLAFVEQRLAIEWDSRRWHTQSDAFDRDRARDRDATLHGWRVLRFTWADITQRGAAVISTIRRALEMPVP